jgi:hypothetical protein
MQQNDSYYISIRNSAADTFTPYRIKDLSDNGKYYMGSYGFIALSLLVVLTIINLCALIQSDTNIIVIINLILPFIISIFTLEKIVATILHILLKQFN